MRETNKASARGTSENGAKKESERERVGALGETDCLNERGRGRMGSRGQSQRKADRDTKRDKER